MNRTSANPRSTTHFSWKQNLTLSIVPPLVSIFYKTLDTTCRHENETKAIWDDFLNANEPFLTSIWHENILLFAGLKETTGLHTLTSHSFDGELAARIIAKFGIGAFRGSSSRGGMQALADMVQGLQNVKGVGFTLDGPRGPRRKAKHGMALLSAKTQLPVLPLVATATRGYRFNSWDRLLVPLPFSRIIFTSAPPICPAASMDKDTLQAKTVEIERAMNTLQESIETQNGVDAKLDTEATT